MALFTPQGTARVLGKQTQWGAPGRPIWEGGGGEKKQFIFTHIEGKLSFPPLHSTLGVVGFSV